MKDTPVWPSDGQVITVVNAHRHQQVTADMWALSHLGEPQGIGYWSRLHSGGLHRLLQPESVGVTSGDYPLTGA